MGGGDQLKAFAERRAKEISQWFVDNNSPVKGWVVIDDINLAVVDDSKKKDLKPLGSKIVQTRPLTGLTMGNAKTAVRILNGEMINKVVVERPQAPGMGLSASMYGGGAGGTASVIPGAGGTASVI